MRRRHCGNGITQLRPISSKTERDGRCPARPGFLRRQSLETLDSIRRRESKNGIRQYARDDEFVLANDLRHVVAVSKKIVCFNCPAATERRE